MSNQDHPDDARLDSEHTVSASAAVPGALPDGPAKNFTMSANLDAPRSSNDTSQKTKALDPSITSSTDVVASSVSTTELLPEHFEDFAEIIASGHDIVDLGASYLVRLLETNERFEDSGLILDTSDVGFSLHIEQLQSIANHFSLLSKLSRSKLVARVALSRSDIHLRGWAQGAFVDMRMELMEHARQLNGDQTITIFLRMDDLVQAAASCVARTHFRLFNNGTEIQLASGPFSRPIRLARSEEFIDHAATFPVDATQTSIEMRPLREGLAHLIPQVPNHHMTSEFELVQFREGSLLGGSVECRHQYRSAAFQGLEFSLNLSLAGTVVHLLDLWWEQSRILSSQDENYWALSHEGNSVGFSKHHKAWPPLNVPDSPTVRISVVRESLLSALIGLHKVGFSACTFSVATPGVNTTLVIRAAEGRKRLAFRRRANAIDYFEPISCLVSTDPIIGALQFGEGVNADLDFTSIGTLGIVADMEGLDYCALIGAPHT